MLYALPLAIILIGVALLVAMLIGVLIVVAAGGSRGTHGMSPMGTPGIDADVSVWGGDAPPTDDRGFNHRGQHSPAHLHHHEPFNPGYTHSSHGDFGSHSPVGHGGFDGGSHGGFSDGGHSGHF